MFSQIFQAFFWKQAGYITESDAEKPDRQISANVRIDKNFMSCTPYAMLK